MTKSSKSCGYTGHMNIMNKKNYTKASYTAQHAQQKGLQEHMMQQHPHSKMPYPEEKCTCAATLNKK